MSFATHSAFDPGLDLMVHGQHNGIPPMFACFDFKPATSVPEGRDCVVIVGTRNQPAIAGHIAQRARKAVVILCPGDKTFENGGRPLPDNVVRMFTTNRSHADPRVTAIPLGVKSSALQLLRYARRHRTEVNSGDRAMLYLNFSIGRHYDLPAVQRGLLHRKDIADRFRGEKWVTDRVSVKAVEGEGALFKYLMEMMQHNFVASPEGFGIDCHRHWESLYLGAIPIVQRSQHMETFSDLPILYTDDYTEINKNYLKNMYENISSKTFDFSKLYAPYYTNMLVDEVNKLNNPAFVLLLSDERSSKERANNSSGFWPAQVFLNRLSRYDSPYKADLQAGSLIPTNEHDQRQWRALHGARISFSSNGAVVVEHTSDTGLVGALLQLRPVEGVTYRVHGEMRSLDDRSCVPKLEIFAPQTKQQVSKHVVDGEAATVDGATKVDFTFTSAKAGTYLQFWPGRQAMLSIRIEPVVV
jgi:hypothetical protein